MSRELIVDASRGEVRVCLVENGDLREVHLSREGSERMSGSLFKGRVANVLNGMQAAFVDIGLERNAFLHMKDVQPESARRKMKAGQEILLQIVKEPVGSKGPRVSCELSLPGRKLVLLPMTDTVGVSQRVADDAERERLRGTLVRLRDEICAEMGMPHAGLIARTAAARCEDASLQGELRTLIALWRDILQRSKAQTAPALLYDDSDVLVRAARDLLQPDIDAVFVSDKSAYDKLHACVSAYAPELLHLVRYEGCPGGFLLMRGLQTQLDKALGRKVWLKSGGTLIIDQTEALTVIDVNTGKFTGTTDLADTVRRTNLEAAREIAVQLRLRDIGGIIVIDFIDMDEEAQRQAVLDELRRALSGDHTRTVVSGFTSLGLVEMTRNKVKPRLSALMQRSCPVCGGGGLVLCEEATARRALEEADRMLASADSPVLLTLHPQVAAVVQSFGGPPQRVRIASDASLGFGAYHIGYDV